MKFFTFDPPTPRRSLLPYALKDSVNMVEFYTIAGHPSLKTFRPTMDADLVKIYKDSDAVCIGKTQIPALSLWWTTENPMTGDTGNPFNKAYKTGGSSGGSGAAVAARIVHHSDKAWIWLSSTRSLVIHRSKL